MLAQPLQCLQVDHMDGEKIHREDEEVKENRGSCDRRRQWRETGELSLTPG